MTTIAFFLGLFLVFMAIRILAIASRARMFHDTSSMYFDDDHHLLNHGLYVGRVMVEKDGKLIPQSRPSSSFIRSIS